MFRSKREEPVEQLSADALSARVGPPPAPRPSKPEIPLSERPEYLRTDGPRPVQPRTWRATVGGSD